MNIAIIGAHGTVGRALVEHFNFLRHTVVEVDRTTDITIAEASKGADVVFVVTLPLADVPDILQEVVQNIRGGRLIIHGSSVQQIDHLHKINTSTLVDHFISFCHCHFHFLPVAPLRKTLLGQNITSFFSGRKNDVWEKWLKDQFIPFDPFWHDLSEHEHDEITTISQLMHMSLAFVIGHVWAQNDSRLLQKAIKIGGPPLRFLVRSVLRASGGAAVASEILLEHPHTLKVITMFKEALDVLEEHVNRCDSRALSEMGKKSRALVEKKDLMEIDESTSALLRFEADRKAQNIVSFHFSPKENRDGLLVAVLGEFSKRGVDFTTTFAQEEPDGGCTFLIGVRTHDHHVKDAVAAVNAW